MRSFFLFDPDGVDIPRARRATETLQRRGPDDCAGLAYVERDGRFEPISNGDKATVFLGHTRLAIIGLTSENRQPFLRSGRALVYNGEIYNFQDLRQQLERDGVAFRIARSDTEVLAAGLEVDGEGFLPRLNGMFAGVHFDPDRGDVLAFRDPTGQKPLFVHRDGRRLVMASELKAIAAYVDLHWRSDLLLRGLATSYHQHGQLFEHVEAVPPGAATRIQLSTGESTALQYWDYVPEHTPPSHAGVEEVLRSAVRRHLIADVSVGLHLSGGVDSTLVLKYVTEDGIRPKCFTISFEQEGYDELAYARRAAEHFGCELTTEVVTSPPLDTVRSLLDYFDEPFYDASAVPTWYVNQLAADRVKVVLGGDGADELFGGYKRYVHTYRGARFRARMGPLWPLALRLLRSAGEFLGRPQWSGKYVSNARLPLARALFQNSHDLDLVAEVAPEDRASQAVDAAWHEYRRDFCDEVHIACITRGDIPAYLASDILTKADRCSMMHSIEQRSPFLDRSVLDHAFSLEDSAKIRGSTGKVTLKEVLAAELGQDFAFRRKSGFRFPLRCFLVDNEGGIRDLVSTQLPRMDLDGRRVLGSPFREHCDDSLQRVWKLFVLANFLEQH